MKTSQTPGGRVLFRLWLLLSATAAACLGVTCTIQFPSAGDGDGWTGGNDGYVPLDQADALVIIQQAGGNEQATVTAWFTDPLGRPLTLREGQAVLVNGHELFGPAGDGSYWTAFVVADEYTVTASEPTRGVEETTLASPAGFGITTPVAGGSASLSGFTVAWTNPDSELDVRLALSQTLFGTETTRTFGPVTDTGSFTFDAEDLADFYQGAELVITVTRSRTAQDLAGFNNGLLSIEHAETVTASPAP